MRLSSEFWVSAYLRQCQALGDFAGLVRKGAAHGGAVFIIVNRLDGTVDLYGPAPQSLLDNESVDDRIFCCVLEAVSEDVAKARIEKEIRFDSDMWLLERESRSAQHDLDVVDLSI